MLLSHFAIALAISIVPADGDLKGCQAYVTNPSRTEERMIPCATRVTLPDNATIVWIERGGAVSPQHVATGEVEIRLPLASSATVRIEQTVPGVRRATLTHLPAGEGDPPFIRAAAADASIIMPAGKAVLISYDANDNILGVSEPLDLPAGRTTAHRSAAPKAAVVYTEVKAEPPASPDGAVLSLKQEGEAIPPAVVIPSETGMSAIWYRLEGRHAQLSARSETLWMEEEELVLRPGQVTVALATMRPLPAINATIVSTYEHLLELLDHARLRVTNPDTRANVREVAVEGRRELQVQGLTPGAYHAALELSDWTITRRADVSKGDADISFEVEPITIKGTITQGGEPATASVAFRSGRNSATAKTNEDGDYEVRLWASGRYQAEIALSDGKATPHIEMVIVDADDTLNWDFAKNEYAVQVLEERTQKAVAGATVSVAISWHDDVAGNRQSVRNVKADENGTVILPPLFPGELAVRAMADGYTASETTTIAIPSGGKSGSTTIPLLLRAEEEGDTLTVLLPDGSPASGAEIIGLQSYSQLDATWRDSVDATGQVHVPRTITIVAVRHPQTASLLRPWAGTAQGTWTLPAAAREPLAVQALDHQSAPVRNARVIAWLGGVRVVEPLLGFLTWSFASTDASGTWVGRNLPNAPLQILIVSPAIDGPVVDRGSYDAMATTIRPPWSGRQIVKAIE